MALPAGARIVERTLTSGQVIQEIWVRSPDAGARIVEHGPARRPDLEYEWDGFWFVWKKGDGSVDVSHGRTTFMGRYAITGDWTADNIMDWAKRWAAARCNATAALFEPVADESGKRRGWRRI